MLTMQAVKTMAKAPQVKLTWSRSIAGWRDEMNGTRALPRQDGMLYSRLKGQEFAMPAAAYAVDYRWRDVSQYAIVEKRRNGQRSAPRPSAPRQRRLP